jgi:hypothetical protein
MSFLNGPTTSISSTSSFASTSQSSGAYDTSESDYFELLAAPQQYDSNDSPFISGSTPAPLPEGEVSVSTLKNVETSLGLRSNVDLLIAFEGKQRVDDELAAMVDEKEVLNQRLRSQMKMIADQQEEFGKLDERLDLVDGLKDEDVFYFK